MFFKKPDNDRPAKALHQVFLNILLVLAGNFHLNYTLHMDFFFLLIINFSTGDYKL